MVGDGSRRGEPRGKGRGMCGRRRGSLNLDTSLNIQLLKVYLGSGIKKFLFQLVG